MKKLNLDEPLNQNERYMYAMAVRLDAICDMLSSIVEYIASVNAVPVTSNEIKTSEEVSVQEEVIEKPKRTRKK